MFRSEVEKTFTFGKGDRYNDFKNFRFVGGGGGARSLPPRPVAAPSVRINK